MTAQRPLPKTAIRAHRRRYWRVTAFFFRAFVHVFGRDILPGMVGLRFLRTPPVPRWVRIAQRYRDLAVELGGVLIKLGQYLSTRVDILPIEVTRELSDLQDEVPPETFEAIRAQVEGEFGQPLQEIYATFMDVPLGAASFAQVHEAQLMDGRPVVVKVLRPGIEDLVEVDLASIGRALGWLKLWKVVRRRVDLDWVRDELVETTLRELDMRQEGAHAERFAESFDGDGDVHIPKIYWQSTTRRVLTEENVAYIKITDFDGLRANGIEPAEVAKKLFRVYMRQIFVHNYIHADPHPGNLFVRPVDREPTLTDEVKARATEAAQALGVDEWPLESAGTPFQILFVDFGMVAEIPPRLRAALRRYMIGMANRDAAEVIQALRDSGSLLPGADLAQLEEALDALFDRFWGLDMARLGKVGMQEAAGLWKEFGHLLRDTPIQVQADLMFAGRAVELLSGIAKSLDDAFNPWTETVPFAQKLAFEELVDWRVQGQDLARQLRSLAKLPAELQRTAGLAQRGRLTFRSAFAPDTRRHAERLERSVRNIGNAVFAGALVVAGAITVETHVDLATGLFAGGAVLWLASWWRGRRAGR
ncbi:MAG: AarF/UbiB family protein [Acidobacteriota bacterium]